VGYVEGKNYERYRLLAAELVGLRVDVLVTSIAPAALAAKKATTTIPIVIVNKDANGLQREYCCFTRNLNANDARMQTASRRPSADRGWRISMPRSRLRSRAYRRPIVRALRRCQVATG
jgi:hypothetical protein